MRIACYNVEWFDRLFNEDETLAMDDAWSSRYNITRAQQSEALALVFTALDADAIMVIEAPDAHDKRSGVAALEHFASSFGLRAREALIGFSNTTQQEIALMYDPDVVKARHAPVSQAYGIAPRFDGVFEIDLDVDSKADVVQFSKPPLEIELETNSGRIVRMIGAHLKSKAPHGAVGRDEIMRVSIANRRKQLAQAVWLRKRVTEHLDAGDSMIVLGDLNDGPGLDAFESLFGRSSVEIVLGQGEEQCLFDPHAAQALERRISAAPTTARFYIHQEKRYLQALLDYIMISPDLRALSPQWRIWHPFDDPMCWQTPELRDALITASDHFPVTLDIDL